MRQQTINQRRIVLLTTTLLLGVVVLTSIAVFWVMQRQAEHQFSLLLQAALHNRVQFMQSELDGAVAGTDGTNTAQ